MTILEALRDEMGIRVMQGDTWLVIDEEDNFVVYRRPYGAKKTRTLIVTDDEEKAVDVLLGRENLS